MSSQILLLDRVEFIKINVEALSGKYPLDETFPQLVIDPDKVEVLTRSDLVYPQESIQDPRVFVLIYGVKIGGNAEDNSVLPYSIEIEAAGYFRYVGGDEFVGENRFRAVRFSGYQILYGAIREMVSSLTARGRHGLWHMPARNFGGIAQARAKEDEARRQAALADRSTTEAVEAPKPRRSRSKKTDTRR
jgi:preprotein translocase subunit SecB